MEEEKIIAVTVGISAVVAFSGLAVSAVDRAKEKKEEEEKKNAEAEEAEFERGSDRKKRKEKREKIIAATVGIAAAVLFSGLVISEVNRADEIDGSFLPEPTTVTEEITTEKTTTTTATTATTTSTTTTTTTMTTTSTTTTTTTTTTTATTTTTTELPPLLPRSEVEEINKGNIGGFDVMTMYSDYSVDLDGIFMGGSKDWSVTEEAVIPSVLQDIDGIFSDFYPEIAADGARVRAIGIPFVSDDGNTWWEHIRKIKVSDKVGFFRSNYDSEGMSLEEISFEEARSEFNAVGIEIEQFEE